MQNILIPNSTESYLQLKANCSKYIRNNQGQKNKDAININEQSN